MCHQKEAGGRYCLLIASSLFIQCGNLLCALLILLLTLVLSMVLKVAIALLISL